MSKWKKIINSEINITGTVPSTVRIVSFVMLMLWLLVLVLYIIA